MGNITHDCYDTMKVSGLRSSQNSLLSTLAFGGRRLDGCPSPFWGWPYADSAVQESQVEFSQADMEAKYFGI